MQLVRLVQAAVFLVMYELAAETFPVVPEVVLAYTLSDWFTQRVIAPLTPTRQVIFMSGSRSRLPGGPKRT